MNDLAVCSSDFLSSFWPPPFPQAHLIGLLAFSEINILQGTLHRFSSATEHFRSSTLVFLVLHLLARRFFPICFPRISASLVFLLLFSWTFRVFRLWKVLFVNYFNVYFLTKLQLCEHSSHMGWITAYTQHVASGLTWEDHSLCIKWTLNFSKLRQHESESGVLVRGFALPITNHVTLSHSLHYSGPLFFKMVIIPLFSLSHSRNPFIHLATL